MTKDELELREILGSFSNPIADIDVFVLKLLDIKTWHQSDKENTLKALDGDLPPLTPREAQKAALDLCKCLGEASWLFQKLNAGTMPMRPLSANITSWANEIRISRVAGEIPFSTEHRDIAIDLAPEVLKWLKNETEKVAEQLVRGQKTVKRVKEFDLFMLAITCQDAGITCSYSEGTPFDRLSRWLLGPSSNRNAIEKIIQQYPYLKDEKNKISEN